MSARRFLALWLLSLLVLRTPAGAADPAIQADVVYGHKDGMALTFDVVTPESPNGGAVLWLQSGGWYSTWAPPEALLPACTPFLNEGLTVVIVRHGSAPKYTVPEAVADVRRAVRSVRLHAEEYGIDPERLGVMGGSAGGHLTLMLATTGDDGDPAAMDEVLRASSRVKCGVSLYPPTDLRGWTTDPPAAIAAIPTLKPPLTFDAALEDDVSPIANVTDDDAPVLLIHGDKDELVPLSHSQNIMPVFEEKGINSELIVVEGAGHGYSPEQNINIVLPAMLKWYKEHLGEGE
jgi:acetyl esterase/lipase